MSDDKDIATLLASVLADDSGAVTPPIVQTSLFTFAEYQDFEDRMAGVTDTPIYTRVQNPTVAAFEGMMARAEAGESWPFSSSSRKRSLVSLALPNPAYCRMVQYRPRYMVGWTPRVYGYSPGKPRSSA